VPVGTSDCEYVEVAGALAGACEGKDAAEDNEDAEDGPLEAADAALDAL
jgi:hypothetical protein